MNILYHAKALLQNINNEIVWKGSSIQNSILLLGLQFWCFFSKVWTLHYHTLKGDKHALFLSMFINWNYIIRHYFQMLIIVIHVIHPSSDIRIQLFPRVSTLCRANPSLSSYCMDIPTSQKSSSLAIFCTKLPLWCFICLVCIIHSHDIFLPSPLVFHDIGAASLPFIQITSILVIILDIFVL